MIPAQALAFSPGIIGPGSGFLVAQAAKGTAHFPAILIAEAIASFVVLGLWVCMPRLPAVAPSNSAAEKRPAQVNSLVNCRNFCSSNYTVSHWLSSVLSRISSAHGGCLAGGD